MAQARRRDGGCRRLFQDAGLGGFGLGCVLGEVEETLVFCAGSQE